MNAGTPRHATLCLAALLGLCMAGFSLARVQNGKIRHVGVPDGAAGIVIRYVIREKMGPHDIRTVQFEPYTLYDCCASAGQYAMSSGYLDIAIMCPDAARALVGKDPRYEIAGPVMKNSDIFIVRTGSEFGSEAGPETGEITIAVSQKRDFQRRMIARRYGERGRPVPMLHAAVPFAYAKGIVQGAVMDITRACRLEGGLLPAAENAGADVVTYVMVIKKNIKKNKTFENFLKIYEQAIRETDNRGKLLYLLKTYVSDHFTIRDIEQWRKLNIRFMSP